RSRQELHARSVDPEPRTRAAGAPDRRCQGHSREGAVRDRPGAAVRLRSLAAAVAVAMCTAAVLAQSSRAFTKPALLLTPCEAFSFHVARDGSVAAAACRDNRVRIWTLPEGRLSRTIETHDRQVEFTAMSEDGRWIAAAGHDGR